MDDSPVWFSLLRLVLASTLCDHVQLLGCHTCWELFGHALALLAHLSDRRLEWKRAEKFQPILVAHRYGTSVRTLEDLGAGLR